MTKRDIVKAVAERTALTQAETRDVVQSMLDAVMGTILAEGRIELRNFGVFEVRWRRPRKARDPVTGRSIVVPERYTVVFKPSGAFERRVHELPPPGA